MAENQIQKVSIKHEAIMDYLIANPHHKLGIVAEHFGVSQAWLSVIINSDVFKVKLKEKNEEVFAQTIIPLRERVVGIAHVGVEKLGEALHHASPITDRAFIADTTDSILKNLGYTPKSQPAQTGTPVNQQNNFYVVDKDTLQEARAKLQRQQKALEGEAEEVPVEPEEGTPTEGV